MCRETFDCAEPQEQPVAAKAGQVNKCLLDLANRRDRALSRRGWSPLANLLQLQMFDLRSSSSFLSIPTPGFSRTSRGAKRKAWGHFPCPLTPAAPPRQRALSLEPEEATSCQCWLKHLYFRFASDCFCSSSLLCGRRTPISLPAASFKSSTAPITPPEGSMSLDPTTMFRTIIVTVAAVLRF